MELDKILKEKKEKLEQLVNLMNSLDTEKSKLIQESLRLDGEIRLLNELLANSMEK